MTAEKAGVPTVTIVETGFMLQAQSIARALGVNGLPIAEYPGAISVDSKELFAQKLKQVVTEQLVKGLRTPIHEAEETDEPSPREIAFSGTLDQVDEFFYDRLWTDGLPIVPPTIDRVEEFLRYTDRSPHEVIGVLLPEKRQATVWNVAVNGVMAGCRPEYMPVLLAVIEAIADPEFRLEDAGSTPGWEPMVIVNGPLVKDLDFNFSAGALRVGRKANSSIGRFLRLYMRNVAGLRPPPGATDKGTIGSNFHIALAENEDAAAEFGWKPYSTDRGFHPGENVVTVMSVVSVTGPTYSTGPRAEDHMKTLAEFIGQSTSLLWSSRCGLMYDRWHPLFVMSPRVAGVIGRDGWSKADVQRYLYENCKITASLMERYSQTQGVKMDLREMVAKGEIPRVYAESDDPNRLIPVFMKPEWIGIVVAGDPARNQSRGYMNNHEQGPPISKRVQ